jgi:hypothetical protein
MCSQPNLREGAMVIDSYERRGASRVGIMVDCSPAVKRIRGVFIDPLSGADAAR